MSQTDRQTDATQARPLVQSANKNIQESQSVTVTVYHPIESYKVK